MGWKMADDSFPFGAKRPLFSGKKPNCWFQGVYIRHLTPLVSAVFSAQPGLAERGQQGGRRKKRGEAAAFGAPSGRPLGAFLVP